MTLLAQVVATVVAMVAQDICGTSLVIAESRAIAFYPGLFDGLGDYASRIGGAVTAGSYVKHGLWSIDTQLLLAATAITSFCTTNAATKWAARLLPQTNRRSS